MKYKVFAYIGSFRGSNSITERVMYSLLENLSETYGIEFNNSIYTGIDPWCAPRIDRVFAGQQ